MLKIYLDQDGRVRNETFVEELGIGSGPLYRLVHATDSFRWSRFFETFTDHAKFSHHT